MRKSAVFLLTSLLIVTPSVAFAEGDGGLIGWSQDSGGTNAYLSASQVKSLGKFPGDDGKVLVIERPEDAPYYEYQSLSDCAQAQPGTISQDVSCAHALKDCPPTEKGPWLRIWRRTLQAGIEVAPWATVGTTCASDVAPGARPTLTMADIKEAFLRTPWSKPQISSQPAGNKTLVNLKTFYAVRWTPEGFEPKEVDKAVLRGIPVSIRPKLVGFTYVFGDGGSLGPTASPGGVYPDGDVTHVYSRPGTFPVRVNTTFGADFSLDGGGNWDEIPSTVTVPGPATPVSVREARAVLVQQ